MATLVKMARTAREIDDVFALRHEVYVVEDGKFGGKPLPGARITDRFAAFPVVANIVAYEENEPVGTLRVCLDTGAGLAAGEHYDFSSYRAQVERVVSNGQPKPRFASAGMLAIREKWRRRRDVIQALMKLATGVCHSWGVTHVVATSNHDTTSIYEHLGFQPLADKVWVEAIGNFIVPMATPFDLPYRWAFGSLFESKLDRFWLDTFSANFERLLLGPGEWVFREGDAQGYAYIVDAGWVALSRKDPNAQELTLATLSRGALFGELALIDSQPRSASATAVTHVELIQLDRQGFMDTILKTQDGLENLLRVFAQRIRRTDELAMVMAYAPQTGRVHYALEQVRKAAVPDPRREGVSVAKVGPTALALSAGVREDEVRRILEMERSRGSLEYGERVVRFFDKPSEINSLSGSGDASIP